MSRFLSGLDGKTIALAGLVAGSIDIGAAMLIYDAPLPAVLHAIAAGLLGPASGKGGMAIAALGLLLQWAMSMLIAAIYAFAIPHMPLLTRRWAAAGLLYGGAVFVVMNYVVMPLSAIGHRPHFTPLLFAENLAAMLLFGLIVAAFVRR